MVLIVINLQKTLVLYWKGKKFKNTHQQGILGWLLNNFVTMIWKKKMHYDTRPISYTIKIRWYLDLDIIDQKIKWMEKATLREVIMNFRGKVSEQHMLCLVVERWWNGQGYKVFYPTIYKEEALEFIKNLPFYLTRVHGEKM